MIYPSLPAFVGCPVAPIATGDLKFCKPSGKYHSYKHELFQNYFERNVRWYTFIKYKCIHFISKLNLVKCVKKETGAILLELFYQINTSGLLIQAF